MYHLWKELCLVGKTNKKYDEEYKKNIVKLVENGKPISDIEREYDLNPMIPIILFE